MRLIISKPNWAAMLMIRIKLLHYKVNVHHSSLNSFSFASHLNVPNSLFALCTKWNKFVLNTNWMCLQRQEWKKFSFCFFIFMHTRTHFPSFGSLFPSSRTAIQFVREIENEFSLLNTATETYCYDAQWNRKACNFLEAMKLFIRFFLFSHNTWAWV